MNRIKKNLGVVLIICSVLLISLLLIINISIPIVKTKNNKKIDDYSDSNNSVQNKEYKYLFNGNYYNSYDEIVNSLINQQKLITHEMYYGNINESILNQEFKTLNISNLRKFNPDRIKEAWLDSLGQHKLDFAKVKKSYVNPGLIRYKYLDFNGQLFNSFSEAKESNKKNIQFDSISYYNILDESTNQNVKINPLNKHDINYFKELILKSFSNESSYFNINLIEKTEKLNHYRIFDQENIFNNYLTKHKYDLMNELKNIFELGIKKTLKKIIVDVKVKFEFKGDVIEKYYKIKNLSKNSGGKKQYVWDDKKNNLLENNLLNNSVLVEKDEQSIIFKGIKLEDLKEFKMFLDLDTFKSKVKKTVKDDIFWIPVPDKWDIAEEAKNIKLFNGKFDILMTKTGGWNYDIGGQAGVDAKILEDGSSYPLNYPQLYFSVGICSNNTSYDYKNMFRNILKEEITKIINSDKKLLYFLSKFTNDLNAVEIMLESFNWNILKNISLLSNLKNVYRKEGNLDDVDEKLKQFNKNADNNLFSDNWNNEIKEIWWSEDEREYVKQIFDIPFFRIYNQTIIKNIFDHFKKFEYLITYKSGVDEKAVSSPIFQVNYPYSDSITWNERESLINYFKKIISKFNINSLVNVSINKWIYLAENKNKFYIKGEKFFEIKTESKTGRETFNESNFASEYNSYFSELPQNNNNYPSNENNIKNGIFNAMHLYNKNLSKLSDTTYELIKDEKLVNFDNVLILNNSAITKNPNGKSSYDLTSVVFAKYLKSYSQFNESFTQISNFDKKLIYDKQTLENRKEFANKINPSKIIIAYDLLGNVINPGIQLDYEENLNIISDVVFDSEDTVLKNIYQTKNIKKDLNKCFYQEDDGSYTLIENKVNFVYQLEYNNQKHYFSTYKYAIKFLKEEIKIKTIKFGI